MRSVILGGGITGMWLALQLVERGERPTLISAEFDGGLMRTMSRRGFNFDLGGHVYNANDPRISRIMSEVGGTTHQREAFYVHDGKMVPYPVQDHMAELGIPFEAGEVPEYYGQSLESYACSVFGDRFYNEWYRPFNRRVWTMDPSEMDSDWVDGRVKLPVEAATGWGPNASFSYAPGEDIFAWFMSRLDGKIDFVKANVVGVQHQHHSVKVDEKPYDYEYDRLFSTLPIAMFWKPCGFDYMRLRYNWVRTFGVGLNTPEVVVDGKPFHWLYCDLRSVVHRVSSLHRYHPSNVPNGKSALLLEVPYRAEPPLVARGIDNWSHPQPSFGVGRPTPFGLERILNDAGFRIEQNQIETAIALDFIGYPLPSLGIRNVVAGAKAKLIEHDIYTAGRWGSHGYFNVEHCMNDAEVAVGAAYGEVDDRYLWCSHYYKPYAASRAFG